MSCSHNVIKFSMISSLFSSINGYESFHLACVTSSVFFRNLFSFCEKTIFVNTKIPCVPVYYQWNSLLVSRVVLLTAHVSKSVATKTVSCTICKLKKIGRQRE